MTLFNDQKEELDKLVIGFQREIAFNKDDGKSMAYLRIVEAINKTYGTEYDTHPENLREYFKKTIEPSERKEADNFEAIGRLLMQ